MDERRATRLGAGYGLLSETELQVVPIIAKCLEGMKVAADAVDAKNVSVWGGSPGARSRHGAIS
jgi:thyroid hormone receptor interactor 10